MDDQPKFRYNRRAKSLEEGIIDAYQKFYQMTRKFPKVIGIPPEDAGYWTPILEVKIDRTLAPGTLWLAGW